MAGLITVCWLVADSVALRFLILFIGVMSCLYCVWDIIDDTVARKSNSSDATAFARHYGCFPSQVWGVIWTIQAIIMFGAGLLVGIVAFKESAQQQKDDSTKFLPAPGQHSAGLMIKNSPVLLFATTLMTSALGMLF